MKRTTRRLGALATLALCTFACKSPHARPPVDLDALPSGGGLVTVDRQPPLGARLAERPTWSAGDRFAFRRGNLVDVNLRVEFVDEERYGLLDEDTGSLLLLDRDLGVLGEGSLPADEVWADERLDVRVHPVDPAYAWPLWSGKRWVGQFLRVQPNGSIVPLVAEYHAQDWEQVRTPFGELDTLRIQRRVRVAQQGEYVERTALIWYAPEVGQAVLRLEDGLMTELVEWHSQAEGRP
jgi:hypothetical protein